MKGTRLVGCSYLKSGIRANKRAEFNRDGSLLMAFTGMAIMRGREKGWHAIHQQHHQQSAVCRVKWILSLIFEEIILQVAKVDDCAFDGGAATTCVIFEWWKFSVLLRICIALVRVIKQAGMRRRQAVSGT